jgi:hypothetical protein
VGQQQYQHFGNEKTTMKNYIYVFVLFVLLMSCRKPYNPPPIASAGNYLVVEGTINTAGITLVKLSQTVSLSSTVKNKPLTGAVLAIQSNQNASYPLTEVQPGAYQSASLSLGNSQQYRLSVKTPGGQQYYSAFETAAVSPPIDSIGFIITGSGLQLYVNTHDPTNSTKYFRWDYNETWQFHSLYFSSYITNGTAIVPRTIQQEVYSCYTSDTASNIVLASTAHLSNSVVNQNPLTSIASTSEKIEDEYSIQVNQYALSADAYAFWNNLKQNSENLGSIFDPLPSEIPGNIHNANNAIEPVIGYVSVCAVQTKRIFIHNQQLPSWVATYPYVCTLDTNLFSPPYPGQNQVALNLIPLGSPSIPVLQLTTPTGAVVGYLSSDADCADCTVRGTTTVPTFWQ